jgi:Ser/Thr protein kinase RdoA (MazF antagonist)
LLEFLPPEEYRLWKPELLAGRFEPGIPHAVGLARGNIHAATWGDRKVAGDFATDAIFDALRLSPYLRTLAERTPDLADPILAIAERTAATHLALVHGDVSPKNILIARADRHPVLLDAECAWYGDPAFDAAFFLNHLVLKASHVPSIRRELLEGAEDFAATWLSCLPMAARADAEQRVAALLPCLMLARVDGKSPVEYLEEDGRARMRALSRPHIISTPTALSRLFADLEAAMQEQDGS